jgi:hypothetical protein
MNVWGQQTYAASNTNVTVANLYGHYFNNPAAGTNVTATVIYAVVAESLFVNSTGDFITAGGANNSQISTTQSSGQVVIGSTVATGTITLGRSAASQTTNIQAGATASGSTKTINLGTAGLSGSTTTIAIGSAVSGATSTTTLNGTYYSPAPSNADLTAVSGQVARSGRLFAARTMPSVREDSGPGYPLAPHFGIRRYVQFQFGSGTTVTTLTSIVGNGAYTCVSGVAPTIVTPNVTEPYYRSTISCTGVASNIAYWVGTRPMVMAGTPFMWVFRFDINSAASNVWQYVGLADVSTAPAAANPTTATTPGRLGLAFNGSTLQIVNNVSGTAPTTTALTGAAYSSPASNAFELIIRSDGTNYYWQIGTAGAAWAAGNGFNQQVNSGTFSANRPGTGVTLFPLISITNNGTGSATTIGPMLFTLETEG